MEQLFETVLTADVALTALAAGGVQEISKQAMKASEKGKKILKSGMAKTAMAIAPLCLGAGFGTLIIEAGGVADPWIMGLISGLFSSSVYDTVKPAVSSLLSSAAQKAE